MLVECTTKIVEPRIKYLLCFANNFLCPVCFNGWVSLCELYTNDPYKNVRYMETTPIARNGGFYSICDFYPRIWEFEKSSKPLSRRTVHPNTLTSEGTVIRFGKH